MHRLKNIFYYLKYERKYIFLAISAVLIETLFELAIPLIMSYMINEGITPYIESKNILNKELESKAIEVITISAILIAVCAFMSLVCGWIYSIFASRATSRFGSNLRKAQFEKIQSYSFSNLDSFEPSSLVTRVINGSITIQNTFQQVLRPLVRAPLMLFMGIILAFYYSWQLALIFVVLVPILAVVIYLILRYVAPKYKIIQKKLDLVNSKIQENLVAIRIIKSFVRKPYEVKEFDNVNESYKETITKTFKVSNLIQPFFQFMMYTSTILFLIFGGKSIIDGKINAGDLTGLLSYVMQTFNALIMLSNIFVSVAKALASIYRVNTVLEVNSDIISGIEDNKVINGDIEFKNVSFKYNKDANKYVLNDISFKLPYGKTLGIIGATGSAKSTLVSLIPRLYDRTDGEILIDGKDIKTYNLDNLRENISVVLQTSVLFEGSLLDNIKWGKEEFSIEELNRALNISCTDEVIEKLPDGINTFVGEGGNNLSGGQKQRVCICRALIKNPKILILDDSTSAVDTQTEKKIRSGLKSINMTKIIISQRILSILDSDYVMILDDGKINEINTPSELLKHNLIYKDLYNRQLKGVDLNE